MAGNDTRHQLFGWILDCIYYLSFEDFPSQNTIVDTKLWNLLFEQEIMRGYANNPIHYLQDKIIELLSLVSRTLHCYCKTALRNAVKVFQQILAVFSTRDTKLLSMAKELGLELKAQATVEDISSLEEQKGLKSAFIDLVNKLYQFLRHIHNTFPKPFLLQVFCASHCEIRADSQAFLSDIQPSNVLPDVCSPVCNITHLPLMDANTEDLKHIRAYQKNNILLTATGSKKPEPIKFLKKHSRCKLQAVVKASDVRQMGNLTEQPATSSSDQGCLPVTNSFRDSCFRVIKKKIDMPVVSVSGKNEPVRFQEKVPRGELLENVQSSLELHHVLPAGNLLPGICPEVATDECFTPDSDEFSECGRLANQKLIWKTASLSEGTELCKLQEKFPNIEIQESVLITSVKNEDEVNSQLSTSSSELYPLPCGNLLSDICLVVPEGEEEPLTMDMFELSKNGRITITKMKVETESQQLSIAAECRLLLSEVCREVAETDFSVDCSDRRLVEQHAIIKEEPLNNCAPEPCSVQESVSSSRDVVSDKDQLKKLMARFKSMDKPLSEQLQKTIKRRLRQSNDPTNVQEIVVKARSHLKNLGVFDELQSEWRKDLPSNVGTSTVNDISRVDCPKTVQCGVRCVPLEKDTSIPLSVRLGVKSADCPKNVQCLVGCAPLEKDASIPLSVRLGVKRLKAETSNLVEQPCPKTVPCLVVCVPLEEDECTPLSVRLGIKRLKAETSNLVEQPCPKTVPSLVVCAPLEEDECTPLSTRLGIKRLKAETSNLVEQPCPKTVPSLVVCVPLEEDECTPLSVRLGIKRLKAETSNLVEQPCPKTMPSLVVCVPLEEDECTPLSARLGIKRKMNSTSTVHLSESSSDHEQEESPKRKRPKLRTELSSISRTSQETQKSNAVLGNETMFNRSFHKRIWTEAEEDILYAGIRKYGFRKWKVIKDKCNLPGRTNRDLCDKWRNIQKHYRNLEAIRRRWRLRQSLVETAQH